MVYAVPGRPPQLQETNLSFETLCIVNTSSLLSTYITDELAIQEESPVDMQIDLNSKVKPLVKINELACSCVVLPENKIFIDRCLPSSDFEFKPCELFSPAYFKDLHERVKQESQFYAAYTPNHRGARIPLYHSKLKIECWRDRLVGYEYPEIVQFLEYGFPLGLTTDPPPLLQSTLRNHGSAYQYYNFIDEFISVGLDKNQLTGPFRSPPFPYIHISPLMTAPKKPDSRRAVFDATYGEFSLNNNTPKDTFLDTPCVYDYPQVDDFRDLIINAGRGCFIWKRDLSRFYLQIPLDPLEYPLVCYVWRNRIYFFTSLMFGLTHSGLQGKKLHLQ